jgi:hypothetical protein
MRRRWVRLGDPYHAHAKNGREAPLFGVECGFVRSDSGSAALAASKRFSHHGHFSLLGEFNCIGNVDAKYRACSQASNALEATAPRANSWCACRSVTPWYAEWNAFRIQWGQDRSPGSIRARHGHTAGSQYAASGECGSEQEIL